MLYFIKVRGISGKYDMVINKRCSGYDSIRKFDVDRSAQLNSFFDYFFCKVIKI